DHLGRGVRARHPVRRRAREHDGEAVARNVDRARIAVGLERGRIGHELPEQEIGPRRERERETGGEACGKQRTRQHGGFRWGTAFRYAGRPRKPSCAAPASLPPQAVQGKAVRSCFPRLRGKEKLFAPASPACGGRKSAHGSAPLPPPGGGSCRRLMGVTRNSTRSRTWRYPPPASPPSPPTRGRKRAPGAAPPPPPRRGGR